MQNWVYFHSKFFNERIKATVIAVAFLFTGPRYIA